VSQNDNENEEIDYSASSEPFEMQIEYVDEHIEDGSNLYKIGSGTRDNSTNGFKAKRKTEICKNWRATGMCQYGDECAFSHGLEELKKKTHVAARYKITQCQGYHKAPFICQYGARCQFAHLQRNFNPHKKQVKSYQHLLTENVYQMLTRIENVEEPEISTFNVA